MKFVLFKHRESRMCLPRYLIILTAKEPFWSVNISVHVYLRGKNVLKNSVTIHVISKNGTIAYLIKMHKRFQMFFMTSESHTLRETSFWRPLFASSPRSQCFAFLLLPEVLLALWSWLMMVHWCLTHYPIAWVSCKLSGAFYWIRCDVLSKNIR